MPFFYIIGQTGIETTFKKVFFVKVKQRYALIALCIKFRLQFVTALQLNKVHLKFFGNGIDVHIKRSTEQIL